MRIEPFDGQSRRSGFTLIEILVVVAIIGVLLTVLLPRIIGVSDQANVVACKKTLQDQFAELELYRQRFGHFPTQSGIQFIGELWRSEEVENDEKEAKLFICPGDKTLAQTAYGDAVGKKAVYEALVHYDTLSSDFVSYSCRDQQAYKLDFSKPAAQLLVCDDDENELNHRFKINCLYLNGFVDDVDIVEFPGKNFVVGPNSPVDKFKVVRN